MEAKLDRTKLIICNLFKNTARISKSSSNDDKTEFVKVEPNPVQQSNLEITKPSVTENKELEDVESKISTNHIQVNIKKVQSEAEASLVENEILATRVCTFI